MANVQVTADNATLTLNGRVFTDFQEGDRLTLTPVNDLTSHTNSANGGLTINKRSDGRVHDLVIRLQKMSDDDIFMNGILNAETTVVLNGSLKEVFVRDGVQGVDTYSLQNGSCTTLPTKTVNDQEGNSLMEYTIRFRQAIRAI